MFYYEMYYFYLKMRLKAGPATTLPNAPVEIKGKDKKR